MSGPNFESIKHLNPYGVEYWEARELQPLLGYKSWREFEGAIERAKTSCEATGNIINDHFVSGHKLIEAGKGAKRPITDYTLSRLACYLIAMNGNPRLKQIAEAQQYFAVSTRKNEMHELRQAHQERIQIRLEVAEGNKQLSEAAANAGVRSHMFGVFHDSGYLGQYALDEDNIRLYKDIPEGGEILDHMGREELASNLFRITQTEGRLRREQIVGEDAAIQAHFAVGCKFWNSVSGILIIPWASKQPIRSSQWSRKREFMATLKSFSTLFCAFCRPWNCQDSVLRVPKFTPLLGDEPAHPLIALSANERFSGQIECHKSAVS